MVDIVTVALQHRKTFGHDIVTSVSFTNVWNLLLSDLKLRSLVRRSLLWMPMFRGTIHDCVGLIILWL